MEITEMAKSKSQQHFMGMVHAYKNGKLDTSSMPAGLVAKVKKAASSISDTEATKFATTKTKGLPSHVKEGDMEHSDGVKKAIAMCKKEKCTTRAQVLKCCKHCNVTGKDCDRVVNAVLGKKPEVKEGNDTFSFKAITFKEFLIDRYTSIQEGYRQHGDLEQHPEGTRAKIHKEYGGDTGTISHYGPSGKFVAIKTKKGVKSYHTSNIMVKRG